MGLATHHVDVIQSDQRLPPRRYAWLVFAILVALMVVDYVDRQVVVSMFPHLKAQWGLSDSQLGALASIVSITVAIGTVPLSLLADRWSRVKSIVLMALVWSLATIACAFARDYAHLFAARSIVGLGEAAYGAAGAALLASIFPTRMRSTVLGAFLAAGLVGSVLGVVLGGVIAEHWGWRAGFGVVGIPGLILALAFRFIVREDRHPAIAGRSGGTGQPPLKIGATLAAVVRPRTLLVTCVGAGLQLIVVSTVWAWMPSYFNRAYGLTPDLAGLKTGLVVLVGGVGAIVWSAVADRLTARYVNARLYVPAAAGVATTVLLATAFGLVEPGALQFLLILAGAATMTGTIGPVAAVVVDVTHPAVRATATAVLSLAQNLIGLAVGPLLTGILSDRFGLPFALTIVPFFCLLAAATLVVAARTYESDQRKSADTLSGIDHAPKPQAA
jgi:predicted MFS family arabinose efflux permease